MMTYRRGMVRYQGEMAGIIEEYEGGYRFTYDDAYLNNPEAEPVSLTLPLDTHIWETPTLFSFFDGLIPEGWLLAIALTVWKLERRDRFGLLLSASQDPVGAVSVEAIV
ncbi:MAG TPA: HipA N-terminal domain-containing protein [Sphaerochaeta sp.]|nr:HipA N-terminal domain-containing protein [Sphaerochaeta sp.]